MNLFLRSIGFKGYSAEDEDALIRRVISAGIKSGRIFRNDKHGRAMIMYGTGVSAGIAVYGRMVKDRFVYDTHFPYLFTNRSVNEKEIVVFRNLMSEGFCAVSEGSRNTPHMFHVSNPLDLLFEIDHQRAEDDPDYEAEGEGALRHVVLKDVNVSYSGMAVAASVLLAAYDKHKYFRSTDADAKKLPYTETSDEHTDRLPQGNGGGVSIINTPAREDGRAVSNVKRAEREDILSIVDTHFYPGGHTGDSFVVLGNITGMREEENIITGQTFYIVTIQADNETFDVAVNTADVIGEPRVGRRFNARMWLHGYVR